MDEIRNIYEDARLTNQQITDRLVEELLRREAVLRKPEATGEEVGADTTTLISLIAHPQNAKRYDVAAGIRASIRKLGAQQTPPMLTEVALALAGGDASPMVLTDLLSARWIPKRAVPLIIRGLIALDVPVQAIPELLRLLDDPWNHVAQSGVGPPMPHRIYPVRAAAIDALASVGIRTRVSEAASDAEELGPPTQQVEIDVESLTRRLEAWALSDDPHIWNFTLRNLPVFGVAGDEVRMKLLESTTLPAEKRAFLHRNKQGRKGDR